MLFEQISLLFADFAANKYIISKCCANSVDNVTLSLSLTPGQVRSLCSISVTDVNIYHVPSGFLNPHLPVCYLVLWCSKDKRYHVLYIICSFFQHTNRNSCLYIVRYENQTCHNKSINVVYI